MPEHLLDRDEIDTALVVAGRAGVAQRVRAEPDQLRFSLSFRAEGLSFEVQEVGEPVADRAPVDPPAALIAEQRRAFAQTWSDLLQIPAQDQVEPVEHRHPPRSRARGLGSLAETHVDLPERATAEVHVGAVQGRGLLRS
jgi:hypothetical protein